MTPVFYTIGELNHVTEPRDLHLILPSVIRVLTNVRSLHIQNVEWDAISPDLRTALAAHSYVSVRLTRVRFTTVSQLLELLSTSPKLQRLSLSGTVFDTSPCRYSSSNIEVDCLEINHQDHDVLDPISCLYPVSLDSLRKLKICLLSYRHLSQLAAFFCACDGTLRILVVHAPRSFFPGMCYFVASSRHLFRLFSRSRHTVLPSACRDTRLRAHLGCCASRPA